jgi:mannosyltransferase
LFLRAVWADLKKLNMDRLAPLLLLLITVAGAILRMLQIGSKGLWLDEAFSVWLGWQPVPDMLAWLLHVDQHPPLYYALLHFWMGLGDDAATVRAFSAFTGTLTIPAIYLLGHRLAGRNVGLLAALILALAPFHVRFAQETRMYTLLTLNATLAVWALARLLTDPRAATVPLGQQLADFFRAWRSARAAEANARSEAGVGYQQDFRESSAWVSAPTRRRWLPIQAIETDLAWLAYIFFTAATVLSHNTAVFFPVAVNLFVFGFMLVRKFTPHIPTQGNAPPQSPPSSGGEAIPSPFPIREGGQGVRLEPPSLSNWLAAQAGVFLLWSPWLVAYVVQAMGVYREFWISAPTSETVRDTMKTFLCDFLPENIGWLDITWFLYAILVLLGGFHFRRRLPHLALLLTLFATPLVGELLVSLRRPIFYDRTLIWASIPLYLLLAAGINQLRYRPYILATVGILATINGLALREYYTHFEKEQWNVAAGYVADHVQDEDMILFNATWVQIPFDFYYRFANRPVVEHGAPVDLFDRGILEPKMTRDDLPRLLGLMRGRQRIWLVYSHNWYTDPQSLIPAALGQELKLLDMQRFYGLEVRLYGVP